MPKFPGAFTLFLPTEISVGDYRENQNGDCHSLEDLDRYSHQHQTLLKHAEQHHANARADEGAEPTGESHAADDASCNRDQLYALPT